MGSLMENVFLLVPLRGFLLSLTEVDIMNEEFELFLQVEAYTLISCLLAMILSEYFYLFSVICFTLTIGWAMGFLAMWFMFTYNLVCDSQCSGSSHE